LVVDCLSELGLDHVLLEEREGDFPSPSVLVNGRDVMGSRALNAAACRLDIPTRERVLTAIRHADAP
jgi:hypothetical protein